MTRTRRLLISTSAMALAAAFAVAAAPPADAQERKSIRWATSSVGFLRLQGRGLDDQDRSRRRSAANTPSPSIPIRRPPRAMKATMDGNGEIGYTADVGMTRALCRRGRLQELHARPRRSWCTPGTPIRWSRSWPCRPRRPASSSAGSDFSGKPVFFTAGRLHELAELPAHLQGARLRVQARPDRPEDARPTRCRPAPSSASVAYTTAGALARVLLEGDRDPHGRQGDQSVPGRSRQAEGGGPRRRGGRSEEGLQQGRRRQDDPGRADPVRLQRARPTCRRTSSTRC